MSSFQTIRGAIAERIDFFQKKRLYAVLAVLAILLTVAVFLSRFNVLIDFLGKFYRSGALYFFLITILITALIILIVNRMEFNALKVIALPENEWFYVILVGVTAFSLYSLHAFLFGMPLPQHGDEYSYLLMAKTFAQGRITNPVHPMNEFFDTMHVINHPSFMSKYPPGQGAVMAIGIFLFNSPIVGVWLSGAVACMTTYWMFRAVFSRKWSLIGSLIAITQPELFSWSMRYYYGYVALIGGTLCLGALFRIVHKQKITYALIFGSGVAILSNSRPWEGLIACIPIGIFIFAWIYRQIANWKFFKNLALKFVVPATIVLLLNFGWMAFYNYKVTGDVFKLPYSVYNEQYDPIPLFLPLFSTPVIDEAYRDELVQNYINTRITRSRVLREFHIHEFDNFYPPDLTNLSIYNSHKLILFVLIRSYDNFLKFMDKSSLTYLVILLAGLFLFFRRKRFLFFVGAVLFCFLLESFATYNQEHYYAPFVGYLLLAIVFVLYQLSRINLKADKLITTFALVLAATQAVVPFTDEKLTSMSNQSVKWKVQPVLEESLSRQPGNHLVLLDYSNGDFNVGGRYEPMTSRVYVNEPDIDNSKIVWANSLGEERNRKLIDYFSGRQVWIAGFDVDKIENKRVYPKLISCSGMKSDYPPNEQLGDVLRQLCPK